MDNRPSYAERELVPLGFKVAGFSSKEVFLTFGPLTLVFSCQCREDWGVRVIECPIHHKPNDSECSPAVETAKLIVPALRDIRLPA